MATIAFPPLAGHSRRTPRPATGYTLVEVLVSSVSMGVLMIGITGAVLLATQAVDDSAKTSGCIRNVTSAMDEFVRDVRCASSITELSGGAMSFIVPDRNGDGLEEKIRYAWSGVVGAPLTRQINDANAAPILSEVRGIYAITYPVIEPNGSGSGGGLLIGHDATAHEKSFTVQQNNWVGEYFLPSLPADATSWSVTQVLFKAAAAGLATGQVVIELRQASAGLPTGTILAQATVPESYMDPVTSQWESVGFSGVSGLSPAAGLCIVVRYLSGGDACKILYQDTDAYPTGAHMVTTSTGGASWTAPPACSMMFKVYGTVTTPSGTSAGSSKIGWMRISIIAGPNSQTRTDVAVQFLNKPELTGS